MKEQQTASYENNQRSYHYTYSLEKKREEKEKESQEIKGILE